MLGEYVLKKLIDTSLMVLKEMLQRKIEEKNKAALEEKKRELSRKQPPEVDIAKINLSPQETATGSINVSFPEANDLLHSHLESIRQWSSTVGFSDLKGTKALSDIFVQLDTYLTPVKLHLAPAERTNTVSLHDAIFGTSMHCVILGQPGAG